MRSLSAKPNSGIDINPRVMRKVPAPKHFALLIGVGFFLLPGTLRGTEFPDHRQWISSTIFELEARNLEVEELPIIEEGVFHSFSSNLLVHLPGSGAETILVLIPLPGPNTRSSPEENQGFLSTSLQLIDELQIRELPFSIDIVYAGAEFEEQKSLRGYLLSPTIPKYSFAVYIEGWGSPGSWNMTNGSAGEVSPGWLVKALLEELKKSGVAPAIQGLMTQLYSLGFGPTTPLAPLLERTIPAVLIGTPLDRNNESTDAQIEGLVRFLTLPREHPDPTRDWERYYILLQFNAFTWFIGEETYLTLTFLLLSAVLLRIRFTSRGKKRYSFLLLKFGLLVLGLSLAMFLLLILGSVLPEILLILRDFPTLFQYNPGAFFLLKVLSGSALFGWVFGAFLLVVPEDQGEVYSAIAIGTLVLDVLLLSVLQVTLGYYYLWALVCTLFFLEAKSLWGKTFWFLLSPFWLIKSLVELFSLDEPALLQAFGGVNLPVDMVVSLLLVPYIAMFLRLRMLAPQKYAKNWILLTSLGFGITAVGLFWTLYIYDPFAHQPKPFQVTLENSIATIESPAPFSEFGSLDFPSSKRVQNTPYPNSPENVTWRSSNSLFLNREVYELNLEFPPFTNEIHVFVETDESEILYDSNFPFRHIPEEDALEVILGDYPPQIIDLRLVVPVGSRPKFRLRITRELPYHPLNDQALNGEVKVIEITHQEFSP